MAYLRIANLKKKYRISRTDYQEVLKGLNVELVAVLGESGCGYACYPLGVLYQFGRGVEEDEAEAERLFAEGLRYAVDRDKCYCKLGNFCYARGEYEKARAYYEEGAKRNNAMAILNLAVGYFNRDFSDIERKRVGCLLAKSAALGNERAMDLYEKLKKNNRI